MNGQNKPNHPAGCFVIYSPYHNYGKRAIWNKIVISESESGKLFP